MARLLLLLALFVPALAFATDDDVPIPYPDEEEESDEERTRRRKLPRRSEETYTPREETEEEALERETPLAGSDDPNLGLAGEFVAGALFPDAANGGFPAPRFAWGLRFTWEVGRTVAPEYLRDTVFADLTWTYSGNQRGTTEVFSDTNLHYFVVAPAYAFPFGPSRTFALFLQGGLGIAYTGTAITVRDSRTEVSSVKPVFQYGLGLRATPTVLMDLPLRVSFRAELTRYRRGYADDTFAGGSVGVDF